MKRIFLTILALIIFCSLANAESLQEQDRSLHQALPEAAADLMPQSEPISINSFRESIQNILREAFIKSKGNFLSAIKQGSTLVVIILLCASASVVLDSRVIQAIILFGAAAIILQCAGSAQSSIQRSAQILNEVNSFSKLLLPTMSGACFSAGMPTTASALYAGSTLFMQILLTFLSQLLLPLTYAYIALSGADAALDTDKISRFKTSIGGFIKGSLKIVMFLFSAYLSLTGLIAGRADALAVKAAKIAVSTAVPVVGGMVSEASETVLIGAKTLLNSAGVFGMLSALAILILPFLDIGFRYIVLKICTAVSSIIGLKAHIRLLDAISDAMGFILAIASCSTLMLFICCFCFMRVCTV